MPTNNFFEDPKEQSIVKSAIVAKYFWAWAKVIISTARKNRRQAKIAYIDLFAGPGRYEDNTKSTPLLVLEKAISEPDLAQSLVTMFNDRDENNSCSLEQAIKALPGIESLKYPPQVYNWEIGTAIVEQFERMQLIPTLFFVDPWGYKGLSLRLVNSVLKNWGCDCIFFFNYNRINMGLNNEKVEEHMDALFGEERAGEIRPRLLALKPVEREMMIVEELSQALKSAGHRFVLPFRFKNDQGTRTSHHLIFVSKDFKGYEIMKSIMAGESSSVAQNVASFEYNPADKRMPLLFELARPIDELANMLLFEFAGKTLTRREIYERHSINKPYTERNYRAVLLQLESDGKIIAEPPANERRKGRYGLSLGENVKIAFPSLR